MITIWKAKWLVKYEVEVKFYFVLYFVVLASYFVLILAF
jgi:hypothetical protein